METCLESHDWLNQGHRDHSTPAEANSSSGTNWVSALSSILGVVGVGVGMDTSSA